MCGIFAYVGQRKDTAQIILDGLKNLEYRGYDSWGVAVVPTTKLKTERTRIIIKKKSGKIGEANVDELPESSFGFGHTRWATHGGITAINAHPHLDCTGTIALIHNGIIENYGLLRNELLEKGHRFISETDTEIAVHLIEEYAKIHTFSDAVRTAFNRLKGLNAVIVLNNKDNTLIAIRNGSPLVIGFGNGENFLASDATALLPYTKTVHFLEDSEMVEISDNKMVLTDVRTKKIKPFSKIRLQWKINSADKGKYLYFMLKEIFEQPKLIEEIAVNSRNQIRILSEKIKNSYGSYMVGCGSAAHACITGAYLFSKIAKKHINWAIGSEFGYQLDFLTPKSLVIALSQSGETMDTLEAVKKAQSKKSKIFAIVNVLGSTLYRSADYKMLIGVGPEKSVCSTKAFTGKLAILTYLAYALGGNINEGKKILHSVSESGKEILSTVSINNIKNLAKKLKSKKHIYVIGRGLSYPASLETALKIKEISYIHAEGFAAGELKHGTLALIDKGTPVIAFLPDDETYEATLAGAMEMKARGGFIIGISFKKHEIFDYYLEVSDAKEATIIPNVMVGQLLAYYLTLEMGYDPDKPRNLAKSVTVK